MDSITAFPLERYRERLAWMYDAGIDPRDLAGKVVAVAAYKGGVGKSTLAGELAYNLGALLIDFEWDYGSVSVALGIRPENRVRAPLLDALESGKPPRAVPGGPWRPDVVPGHRDFEAVQPTAERMADLITEWAAEWGRTHGCPVVIDTHPGGSPSTLGAMSAADVTVSPVTLEEKVMEATAQMLDELAGYPIIVVPNKIGVSPPAKYIRWLTRITTAAEVPVSPVLSYQKWIGERGRRMVISTAGRQPVKKHAATREELRDISQAVAKYVLR